MLSVQRKTEVIGRSEYAIVSLNSEVAVLTDWKRHAQNLTLLYPVIFLLLNYIILWSLFFFVCTRLVIIEEFVTDYRDFHLYFLLSSISFFTECNLHEGTYPK